MDGERPLGEWVEGWKDCARACWDSSAMSVAFGAVESGWLDRFDAGQEGQGEEEAQERK